MIDGILCMRLEIMRKMLIDIRIIKAESLSAFTTPLLNEGFTKDIHQFEEEFAVACDICERFCIVGVDVGSYLFSNALGADEPHGPF